MSNDKKMLWPLGLTFVGLLIVTVPYVVQFWGYGLSDNPTLWASFSAYFGGLVSHIIAFSVLIYIYKTFEVQRKELNATQSELRETRKEQQKQTQIQKLQGEINIAQLNLNSAYDHKSRHEHKLADARLNNLTEQIQLRNTAIGEQADRIKKFNRIISELQEEIRAL